MSKRVPTRHCYLAVDEDQEQVAEWLNALQEERTVNDRADRTVYYFRGMANEPLPPIEQIDQEKTPLIFNIKPQRVRGTLWTDAEVEFTPVPLKAQFPRLYQIHLEFAKWIKSFDFVFSQKDNRFCEWNYYLEGGIRNFDAELYALPQAMKALRLGQYFVHHRKNVRGLEALAKTLRLRGYAVEDA